MKIFRFTVAEDEDFIGVKDGQDVEEIYYEWLMDVGGYYELVDTIGE